MKTCSKCLADKPINSFSKRSKAKGTLQAKCKVCVNEYNAKYVASRPKGEAAERMRRWRKDNPVKAKTLNDRTYSEHRDRRLAQNKAWAKENPEKVREITSRFRNAHREQRRAESKAYAKANPDKRRETVRRRRGRLKNALQDGIAVDYIGKECFYCGAEAQCIDHFEPLSKSLDDRSTNKVPACNACNFRKSDIDPWIWLASSDRPPNTRCTTSLDF